MASSPARTVLGATCLAVAVVLGSCAGYLATIPGPRGQHPHPDAAASIFISGIAALVLLRVGIRWVRKEREDPSVANEETR